MNYVRTAILLAGLTAIFGVVGALLGGQVGMLIALVVAGGMNFYAYWNSDKMALAATGAHEVDERTAPELWRMVAELAARADLPMPRVYVVESDQPNAFATGRNPENGAVAVNTGLVRMLTREELAGVIAHELAHIKNRDTLIMTITATLAGAISSIAQWGLLFGGNRNNGLGLIGSIALAVLAPLAAMMVQMAISRSREYVADSMGGEICGNPHALAGALEKISRGVQRIPDEAIEGNPALAHMFIVNPLVGRGVDNLFSTHPNVENRIAALEQQAARMGISRGDRSASSGVSPWDRNASPWGNRGGRSRGPWG